MSDSNKVRRKRIGEGLLVASTNPVQYACIKALQIIHRYDYLTKKRIKRHVLKDKEDD